MLSNLAQNIIDTAISEAKRCDSEYVQNIHVLSAIRRWQEEQFDQKFPDLSASIRSALTASRGSALKVKGFIDPLSKRVESIQDTDDVWNLALELVKETENSRNDSAKLTQAGALMAKGKTVDSVDDDETSIFELSERLDPLPFSITSGLIERIAAMTKAPVEIVKNRVLIDAKYVAKHVLGRPLDDLDKLLCTSAGFDIAVIEPSQDLSEFVNEVSQFAEEDACRIATQLAGALAEVGFWAAAIDDEIAQDETDRIDEIKLKLREQLGDRLDTQSDAILNFERKFANLVGMDDVKADLRKRVDYLVVNQRRSKRGLKSTTHRMHMGFLGNPGTGKTTVARLYGELLHELGLLPTNKLIETDRSGLVGEYIGHSEARTLKALNNADGGVLFIDEAYALHDLYGDDRSGFGTEVTNCLVKQMEDRRARLVVILAGYTKPMKDYIASNEGLKSRIPMLINFPDYSIDELIEITQRIAASRDLILTDSALDKIGLILNAERHTAGFGNARSVENILESAQRSAAGRMSKLGNLATELELRTLLPIDISPPELKPKKQFGFGSNSQV